MGDQKVVDMHGQPTGPVDPYADVPVELEGIASVLNQLIQTQGWRTYSAQLLTNKEKYDMVLIRPNWRDVILKEYPSLSNMNNDELAGFLRGLSYGIAFSNSLPVQILRMLETKKAGEDAEKEELASRDQATLAEQGNDGQPGFRADPIPPTEEVIQHGAE
jgi:hypothetical protein